MAHAREPDPFSHARQAQKLIEEVRDLVRSVPSLQVLAGDRQKLFHVGGFEDPALCSLRKRWQVADAQPPAVFPDHYFQ